MDTLVDVRKAVAAATKYFKSAYDSVQDVRLEEVEISDDERYWHITLSGLLPVARAHTAGPLQGQLAGLADLFGGDSERVYEMFTVDAATDSVRAMKIRSLP